MSNIMHKTKGYIALTTVLLVSAVTLVVTVTVTFVSLNEGQSSLASSKGEERLSFVDGCTEDAILKIRNNASYAGGTTTTPDGNCTIVVSKVGTVYTVTASPADMTYVKKIQAVVTRGATTVTITSWQEI
jgi:hypothetical protein